MYCKDVDLLAPDYRSTMPLLLGDTCNPNAAVQDGSAPMHDNIKAIALAQNEVLNHNDTSHLDVNPKISVRGIASQEDFIITIPSIVKTVIIIGSAWILITRY